MLHASPSPRLPPFRPSHPPFSLALSCAVSNPCSGRLHGACIGGSRVPRRLRRGLLERRLTLSGCRSHLAREVIAQTASWYWQHQFGSVLGIGSTKTPPPIPRRHRQQDSKAHTTRARRAATIFASMAHVRATTHQLDGCNQLDG